MLFPSETLQEKFIIKRDQNAKKDKAMEQRDQVIEKKNKEIGRLEIPDPHMIMSRVFKSGLLEPN